MSYIPGERFNPYGIFTGIWIPDFIFHDPDLTPLSKLLYGRLLRYAGRNGISWPSQEELANEMGTSLSTIEKSLKKLAECKYIEIERPRGKDRLSHKTNRYYFIWKENMDGSENHNEPVKNNGSGAGAKSGSKVRESVKAFKKKSIKEKNSFPQRIRTKQYPKKITKRNLPKKEQSFLFIFPKKYRANSTFRDLWLEFEDHRQSEIKVPITPRAAKLFLADFKKYDIETVIKAIRESLKCGYRGIFPQNKFEKKKDNKFTPTGGIAPKPGKYDEYE